MKNALFLFPLIAILVLHANCSRHEEIVNLTSPIVYALARNAAAQGKSSGSYTIELKFENINKTAEGWPSVVKNSWSRSAMLRGGQEGGGMSVRPGRAVYSQHCRSTKYRRSDLNRQGVAPGGF